ncbi:MAG: hypothetical protein ACYTF6_02275 [Planctomycetota bacterium]|jgi:hypothetical protein
MALWRYRAGRAREGLLAIILFVVLLAAVGVAALLVHQRSVLAPRRGREIINEIRRLGLGNFWSRQVAVSRYVSRDRLGRPVSAITIRTWWENGRFKGQVGHQTPKQGHLEDWALDDKLTDGEYTSAPTNAPKTAITLRGDRLIVTKAKGFSTIRSDAPLPENYIPEGTLALVARLVTADGQRASFKTIINETAIEDGKVNFTRVTMVPLSGRSVRIEFRGGPEHHTKIYKFDKQGEVEEILYPDFEIRYIREQQQTEQPQGRTGTTA